MKPAIRRLHQFHLWLSDDEKTTLEARARAKGLSAADILRRSLWEEDKLPSESPTEIRGSSMRLAMERTVELDKLHVQQTKRTQ